MATSFTYRSDEIASIQANLVTAKTPIVSPGSRTLFRSAQLAAVIAALACVFKVATWGDNSPLSYSFSLMEYLALIPVALVIHQLLRTRLSEVVLAIGVASFLRYIVSAVLVGATIISTRQESDVLHFAWIAKGLWLLIPGILLVRSRTLPWWVGALGVVAGILWLGAEVAYLQVASMDWRSDPSLVSPASAMGVRGNILSMVAYLVLPFWLFGMAFVLGRRAPATLVGVNRAILVEPLLLLVLFVPLVTQRPPELIGFDVQAYVTDFDVYDCADFKSQGEAQAVLRANPADPNRLASNKGLACENNRAPFDWIPVRVQGPSVEPLYTGRLMGRGTVAFVALDDFDQDLLDELTRRQERRFGLSIAVLPDLFVPWPEDDRQGRLKAETAIARMKAAFPDAARDPRTAIVAFTTRPLYQQRSPLEVFGPFEDVFAHHQEGRLGIISSNAMDYDSLGSFVDEGRFMSRLDKYTTRYVGNLYFRIPRNDDPHSLFARRVGGMDDVDRWRDDLRRE